MLKNDELHHYKLTIAMTEMLIPDDFIGGLMYPTIPHGGNTDNLAA